MIGDFAKRSLTVRLIVLLTIALLPLGSIAVFQTYRVVAEADELSEREMLARTFQVARAQVELIVEAQGAGKALGAAVAKIDPGTPLSSDLMRQFTKSNSQFVFAGFIEASGLMRCASVGETTDFGEYESWASFIADPRPTVVINRQGTSSGLSVLIVNIPVYDDDGALLGATSVSIPHSLLDALAAESIEDVDVAITDGSGKIMSVSGDMLGSQLAGTGAFKPSDLDLTEKGSVVDLDGYPRSKRAVSEPQAYAHEGTAEGHQVGQRVELGPERERGVPHR